MTLEFLHFLENIKQGIDKGVIKLSRYDITDFDWAVYYAVCRISKKKGCHCDFSLEEIHEEMSEFAPELLEE